MADAEQRSAKVLDLADMKRRLRPPEPNSLTAVLQRIEAVRFGTSADGRPSILAGTGRFSSDLTESLANIDRVMRGEING